MKGGVVVAGQFVEFSFGSQGMEAPLKARLSVPERVNAETGLTTLIHGWGCGRTQFDHMVPFCEAMNLYGLQIEYRGSGEASGNGVFDVPYEMGKLQAIDALRAVHEALRLYPAINTKRLFLIGGSGGGHNVLQAMAFAPNTFALTVALAPISRPTNRFDVQEGGYRNDPKPRSGTEFKLDADLGWGWEGTALGKDKHFTPAEWDIRDCQRPQHVSVVRCPVVLVHGSRDEVVDVRHSLDMAKALIDAGKRVSLHLVDGGDHGCALSFATPAFPLGGLLEQFSAPALRELTTDGNTDFDRRETVSLGPWAVKYESGIPELVEQRTGA